MSNNKPIHRIAIVGTGVIGASWAAEYLAHVQGRGPHPGYELLAPEQVAGLGIAWLPDHLIKGYLDSGALVQVMTRYPVPTGGLFVVRPPGQHSTRKVRVLTELLIEHFG